MSPARPRGNENMIDFNDARPDEAVGNLLTTITQKKAEARLPKEERQRMLKERNRQKARLAKRINIDLPEDVKARLIALAQREGVPVSQLAAFILIRALPVLEKSDNPLWGYRKPAKSPKYIWIIELGKLQDDVAKGVLA